MKCHDPIFRRTGSHRTLGNGKGCKMLRRHGLGPLYLAGWRVTATTSEPRLLTQIPRCQDVKHNIHIDIVIVVHQECSVGSLVQHSPLPVIAGLVVVSNV